MRRIYPDWLADAEGTRKAARIERVNKILSKFIDFGNMTLRQAYIIKYSLRDSPDPESQKLYQEVSEKIDERKKEMKIN